MGSNPTRATAIRGRSSDGQSARLSGERPPVRVRSSPPSWWPWCNGSTRGRDPRGAGSNPAGRPRLRADAEHRRAQPRCNPVASRCGGSTPPVRIPRRSPGDVAQLDEHLACNEEDVGSTPTVSTSCLRSVNGKHAPFVRPRCGFDSCRRLLRTPVAQWTRALSCDGRGRWFDSSRAYHCADVAQTEEHRSATPGRPVRSGSSASHRPVV